MKEPVTAYGDPIRAQTRAQIVSLVKAAVRNHPINGKCGRDELQELVATHVRKNGLVAETEDKRKFLSSAMPGWRTKDNNCQPPR